MHQSAMFYGRCFFEAYCPAEKTENITIVEIGSQDVNGSLRDVAPPESRYIGLDFVKGKGVDIVIDDPYNLPLPDASVSAIVSSSCFEHSEFFWLVFLEAMRVLKEDGVFYLNAPSNGIFHRYPSDCWRFYPDSGHALAAWGKRNGYNTLLLESFTGQRSNEGIWNDFVAVFLKDARYENKYPRRIAHSLTKFHNGYLSDKGPTILNYNDLIDKKPEQVERARVVDYQLVKLSRELDGIKSTDPLVSAVSSPDYERWRERRSEGSLSDILHIERIERLWKTRPLFEIALILKPGQESLLADTIDSLAGQRYDGWRLAIFAQSASPGPEFTADSEPVRWITCSPENLSSPPTSLSQAGEGMAGINQAFLNDCLAASTAHWFGFFDCGTRFSEDAFLTLGDYIAIRPQWRVIYTDDDFAAPNGGLHSPRFKPDLNLELLRSTDYVGGFFIEKQALIEAGGFSVIAGAERYDLLLRAIDALGETSVGHIPEIPVHLPDRLPSGAGNEGATEALRRHFDRRKTPVSILPGLVAGETRRVVYIHEEKPKVSIIVPTRNRLDLLAPCVESLIKKTAWPDWELLIVDNDSDDPVVLAYFDKLRELLPERVNIISVPGDFDFSAMNNRASRQARGDYLLLLNNDTECLHEKWLDAMMSYAQRPDVGIVGARLLFPENLRLQHAGMILGAGGGGTAGHVFLLQPHDIPGYMNRALAAQEYSAVTGACLLIRASIYHQVTGLDPLFKIQHQDVDLCLKVVELGYRVIWTPFATLIHRSSASLRHAVTDKKVMTSVDEETENFVSRWRHRLFRDPAWNRHLSIGYLNQDRTPRLDVELLIPWNPDFHDRPRILFMPGNRSALEDYRGGAALRVLNAHGRLHHAALGRPGADGTRRVLKPAELDRLAPDTLFMHLPVDDASLNALLRYRKHNSGISLICLIDEYPNSPSDEIRLQIALSASHRLIVGTEPLKEAFREMIGDIRVVPDALERRIWGELSLERGQRRKPRAGWAGAGDSHFMRDIVKATHREVDWVFFGVLPDELLSELRPCLAEYHEFHERHDFETYPAKLASLDLDLALAPLEIHPFNEVKSNRCLLEYGILGWPVICTDILPYQTGNPPALRLPNEPDKWVAAIRDRVGEPDALAREGNALREWVEKNHLLENRLDSWLDALCQANPGMDSSQ